MRSRVIICLCFLFLSVCSGGQRKIVHTPDIPGYVTLKCDFHLHTVFSDGKVWPTVRIDEAVRDGLDAVAITDHLEYTPLQEFVKNDPDAPWKICEEYARERNIILVHGTEIGRNTMPPGHMNALFIQDASLCNKDSVWDCYEEAIRQGAFLMWNHPGWKNQRPDGIPKMYAIHHRLIEKGWLHAIEFFNNVEYYPLVLEMCRQNNLAVMANSDVHGLISEVYRQPDYPHRPMTLVFAKERSHEGLREALFAGRTLAWFRDTIAGKEEFAGPFFDQCITVGKPYDENEKKRFIEITNNSDIPFNLVNGNHSPRSVTLNSNTATRIAINKTTVSPLVYEAGNILTGEKQKLRVEIRF
jgi:hypothetical protein